MLSLMNKSDSQPHKTAVTASAMRAASGKGATTTPGRVAAGSRKLPAELLTPDEVRALIRAASATAPTGVRNRALLTVLYRGGLRVGEALALYPKDVDAERGTIRVLHGKGDRDRLAVIDDGALAVVARWIDLRRSLGISSRRRLFCTLAGGPLQPSYVRQLLPRLAARAGIDKRVHPHGLRHAHAVELVEDGVPVHHIRDQLGHSSLAVTDRYLRRIAPGARLEALRGRRWEL